MKEEKMYEILEIVGISLLAVFAVLLITALLIPLKRAKWAGQEIAKVWQADDFEYQQGVDGRVRRRYNSWGETDFWGGWHKPDDYKQPKFHGFPCSK